jgi:HEAT repeat protein
MLNKRILIMFALTALLVTGSGRAEETVEENVRRLSRIYSLEIRTRAEENLVALGAPAVPALIETFRNRGNGSYLRSKAIILLGRIGAVRAIPYLNEALQDSGEGVQASALISLGMIRDEKAACALVGVLRERNIHQAAVIENLVKLGPLAVPALLDVAHDDDSNLRQMVAQALGRIGDKRATPFLIEALADEDAWVRFRAAQALGRIGDRESVPVLIKYLPTESYVRRGAVGALGHIGDRRAVSPLIEVMRNEENRPEVRCEAALSLAQIGDRQAVTPLVKVLEDPRGPVRLGAAQALGEMRTEEAILPLVMALKDKKSYVRYQAAVALGKIGDSKATIHLTEVLKDQDFWVRRAAGESLVKIGTPALPVLKKLAEKNGDCDRISSLITTIEAAEQKTE